MRKGLFLFAAIAACAAAQPVAAATTVWTFAGSGAQLSNNAVTTTSNGVKLQITAWTTNKSSNYFSGNSGHKRADLGLWDYGLGVLRGSGDFHAVDNTGNIDYLLLQFDTEVTLENVAYTSGWYGYDSDSSISNAAIDRSVFGGDYKTVSNAFWNEAAGKLNANLTHSNTLTNNFTPGIVNLSVRDASATPVTSNVWLIAAKFGGSNGDDGIKDAFKVAGFSYSLAQTAVPEPSTWAMLIVGMGVVGGAMRTRTRARLAIA